MDIEFRRKEKVVGFFLLAITMLLFLSLAFIGRAKGWFQEYVEYYAVFEETYNIQSGAPVKLYNAEIGKVKDMNLVDDEVIFRILIVEEYANRVRTSSYVTIKSPTLIGKEYIALVTEDKTSPMIPEGERIRSVGKTDLMEEFKVKKTAKLFVAAVEDLSDVARKLNATDSPVFSILHDIEAIVGDIEKGKGNVGELLRTSKLNDEIHNRLGQVEKILESVRDAVSKTPYTMDMVNNNLERVDRIGGNIENGTEDILLIIQELEKNMRGLETIINNIKDGSEDVPPITRSTLDGLEEIRIGVKKADDAIEALQRNFLIRNNLPERKEPGQYKTEARP